MQIRERPIILTDKKWYDKIHLTDKSRVTMILGDINHHPQVVITPKLATETHATFSKL